MYSNRLALAALALTIVSCSRQETAGPPRIAVLRFENLSSDVSLDWMGRAASEIIASEIGGGKSAALSGQALRANPLAQSRPVSAPGESSERSAALAEGATRLVLGQLSRTGNRLILDVTERDAMTQKTVQAFTLATPNPNGLYTLADGAAHRLSPQVTPFQTRNNEAIADWARALEETDYQKASDDYSRAVQADPEFAGAWLNWAAAASAHGDKAAASRILSDAQQHANRFSERDRARLKFASVQLTGDRAATLAAMNELGRLSPDDPDTVRAIADQNFAARQFQTAASQYRVLTHLRPNDPRAWNQLGYSLMYTGDYGGAMTALRSYQRLVPADPNPIDSQGDVAFAFGRFSEAADLYDKAAAMDPNFQNSTDLFKAAEAQLMTGDVSGASKKFDSYGAARRAANDTSLPFRTAEWLFVSGKHDQAFAVLGAFAATAAPQVKSVALTQMAAWDLQLDRRARALQEVNTALQTGSASAPTLIVRFAAEDAHNAADWSSRADRMFAAPQLAPIKPLGLAYALYYAHEWQSAEPVWKQLADQARADDIEPVIYADILVRLNRPKDAARYVRLFLVPHPNLNQEFLSLAMPRIFEIRAAVLASEGKTAEAESSRKIFRTLWAGT